MTDPLSEISSVSPLPMRKVDSCDVDLNVVRTTYWAGWIMRRVLTVTYWGAR